MAENSAISWCTHTFNPWMGCTAISPACDLCYARTLMQLPADWGVGYPNVALGSTLENQEVWDRDIDKLMLTPAWLHFVSVEPMLGRIDIGDARPNWIITGGESGPGFRPLDMDAVRFMRDQCGRAGIAYHHKQNGGITGKMAGCLVDGVEHKYFPEALAA